LEGWDFWNQRLSFVWMENWKSLVIQRRRFTDSIPSRL
jgi:hypothetical protein